MRGRNKGWSVEGVTESRKKKVEKGTHKDVKGRGKRVIERVSERDRERKGEWISVKVLQQPKIRSLYTA